MKNTTVFTSSIENSLMKKLRSYANKYKLPKNKIIESALNNYFELLKKAEYAHAFRKEKEDPEMLRLADAGLDDFLKMVENLE